jgi:mevalonate pyrophosphate decarboxylase
MGDYQRAQAVELVRALRHQLRCMTTQLATVESQDETGRNGRAVRMEAAELRRDIDEAQALIDQLQRCYLNGDRSAPRNSHLSSSSAGSGRW